MMNFFKFISLVICFLPLSLSFSQGITNNELSLLFEKNDQVIMYVGDIREFEANQLERAAISTPAVADITSAENDSIIVSAKDSGYTKLNWKDINGDHTVRIHVILEDISLFKSSIDELLESLDVPNIITKIAKNESKIILLGEVPSEMDLERLQLLLATYEDKIINLVSISEEDKSVKIEIDILEINKGGTERLGIEWPGLAALSEPARWGTLAGAPDALFRITDWTRTAFLAEVNFLVNEGSARILSRPRLVCQSGKEAELLVGGEVPILVNQQITASETTLESITEVEYKEYGINLTINPRVTPKNRIKIALNVEISDVDGETILGTTAAPTAIAYPFTKRNTSTELVLDDAQTLVIGGLIKEKKEISIQRFPFLSDLPILGILFRNQTISTGGGTDDDTELVIALTPTIIDPDSENDNSQASTNKKSTTTKETAKKNILKNRVSKAILNKYVQQIAEKIKNAFVYPAKAKEQKLEGSVQLSLQLSSAGQVLEAKITQPSGHESLDTNALKIARQVSPYPSFPSEIEREDLWINIPIVYNLK